MASLICFISNFGFLGLLDVIHFKPLRLECILSASSAILKSTFSNSLNFLCSLNLK